MNKRKIIILVLTLFGYSCFIPSSLNKEPKIEILLSDLSIQEKVGQMFMLRYRGEFYREDAYVLKNVKRLITDHHIGGIIS